MKKMHAKVISVLLSVMMIFNLLPMAAFAEGSVAQPVAVVGETPYATLQEAVNAGGTVVLMQDITLNSLVNITKDVVIDGQGQYTVTGTAQKTFEVRANATFKDVAIVNTYATGRCIDTRAGDLKVTLNNATLTTTGAANTQPLTIGGSGTNIQVEMVNSEIHAGSAGYAIITFNPVQLTATGSTLSGYAVVYAREANGSVGSAGSVFNFANCELIADNNSPSGTASDFGALVLQDSNVTVNVTGNSTISANKLNGSEQAVVVLNYDYNPNITGSKINIGKDVTVTLPVVYHDVAETEVIVVPEVYSEELLLDGFAVKYDSACCGEGQVRVSGNYNPIDDYVALGEDGTPYADLQVALNAGGVITLVKSVDLTGSTTLTVPAGVTVTLDLNGHTIACHDSNAAASYQLILNKGNLTINDSVGGGGIRLSAEYNRAWNAYSAVISNQGGTLTIDGGTLEHLGGTDMAYVVDNNSTLGQTTLTINGGALHTPYIAVRLYVNHTTAANNVTINDGLLVGGKRAVWSQLPSTSSSQPRTANITITGGELVSEDSQYNMALYSSSQGESLDNITIAISGGLFNGNVFLAGANNIVGLEKVTITGGEFMGTYGVYSYAANVPGFITGGLFYADVTDYVATGYAVNPDGPMYEVHAINMLHYPAKDATCTEMGNYEYWYCRYCGAFCTAADHSGMTDRKTVEIAPLGHEYVGDSLDCNRGCGYTKPAEGSNTNEVVDTTIAVAPNYQEDVQITPEQEEIINNMTDAELDAASDALDDFVGEVYSGLNTGASVENNLDEAVGSTEQEVADFNAGMLEAVEAAGTTVGTVANNAEVHTEITFDVELTATEFTFEIDPTTKELTAGVTSIAFEVTPMATVFVDSRPVNDEPIKVPNELLKKSVTFRLPVPTVLGDNFGYVEIEHNGVNIGQMEIKQDATTGDYYVEIVTDSFSPFKMLKFSKTPKPVVPSGTGTATSPKTGDNTAALCAGLMALSVLGMATLSFKKRED